MKRMLIAIAVVALASNAFADTPATGAIVRGVVTSVTGPVITVMNNVKIDVSSAAVTRGRQISNAGALVVGSRVLVVISPAPPARPGVLSAEAVSIDPAEGTVIGPLASLTTTSVTLDGQTIGVDSSTMYDGYWNEKPIHAASDIAAGMPVSVEVTSVSNGLQALEVRVLGPAPASPPIPPLDETTITGAVTSIGADVWTVGTTKINITLKTTIGTPAPKVGDNVAVTGVKLPDGALIADMITVK